MVRCGTILMMLGASGCFLIGGSHHLNTPGSSDANPVVLKGAPPLQNPPAEQIAWSQAPRFITSLVRVAPGEPPPAPLRTYVVGGDSDWAIDRTPSGRMRERTLQALVFYKGGASGKCREVVSLLVQNYEGGGNWSAPYLRSTGTIWAVSCDSIEAQRPSPPSG